MLVAYTITRFMPLQWFINELPARNIIKLIFSCSKCLSFWFGLIYTHNFWLAASSSLIMTIVEKYILSEIEQIKF